MSALKITTWETSDEVICPNCEHPMGEHPAELGCCVGWTGGAPADEECECPLTLALQWAPPSEKAGKRYGMGGIR